MGKLTEARHERDVMVKAFSDLFRYLKDTWEDDDDTHPWHYIGGTEETFGTVKKFITPEGLVKKAGNHQT